MYPVQEVIDPFHTIFYPWFHGIEGAQKHLIQAKSVGSIAFYHIIGIDHVLQRFGHFSHNLCQRFTGDRMIESTVPLNNQVTANLGPGLGFIGEGKNHSLIK